MPTTYLQVTGNPNPSFQQERRIQNSVLIRDGTGDDYQLVSKSTAD
jgi:hypothetical protein